MRKRTLNMLASIIIPVLNEEKFIEKCVDSFIYETKFLSEIEILIIDGGSQDETLDVITNLMKKHNQIVFFKNDKKIQSSAMNIGINNSSGKFVLRLDAHAEYSGKYIDNCIKVLSESEDDIANVGGLIKTVPSRHSLIANSISEVLSSKLGVGNSTFRVENTSMESFVDTVPFGCFRRTALEEVGFFDENLVRGEDLEINFRLRKNGKKILLSPKIHSTYFSRSDLFSFTKQALSNGFYITNSFDLREEYHQLRHFVPLFFVCFLFFSILLFLLDGFYWLKLISLSTFTLYLFLIAYHGIGSAFKNKSFSVLFVSPIILFILHFAYGLGSIIGLFYLFKQKII